MDPEIQKVVISLAGGLVGGVTGFLLVQMFATWDDRDLLASARSLAQKVQQHLRGKRANRRADKGGPQG